MAKVKVSIDIDEDLKNEGQVLYSSLGLDLSMVMTLTVIQSLRVQGLPFQIEGDSPVDETLAAMDEFEEMKSNPEKYRRHRSIDAMFDEILNSD